MGQCGYGSELVSVRVVVGQCVCVCVLVCGCGSERLWVSIGVGQNGCCQSGCGSVWIWVRVVVMWAKHCPSSCPTWLSTGVRTTSWKSPSKRYGMGRCGSVWVWVTMGVCQSGCGLVWVCSGSSIAHRPVQPDSVQGSKQPAGKTKQKVGCGSVLVCVRVGVGQSRCDVGQAFRHRPVQPDNQLEMIKQKAGFGSVRVLIRVGMGQCGC